MFKNVSNNAVRKMLLFNNTNKFVYCLNGKDDIYISNMKGKHLDNVIKKGKAKESLIQHAYLIDLIIPTDGNWIVIDDKNFDVNCTYFY
jgi:hypothetical protein